MERWGSRLRGTSWWGAASWIVVGLSLGCSPGPRESSVAPPVSHAEVDRIATAALDESRIPGLAVVVLGGDAVLLARGYGLADPAQAVPVTERTEFELGSIGKQFLAAGVLRLVEQGRLSLDDAVIGHLPAFVRLPPQLRIRHLLNQTSGIREPFTLPAYQAGIEDLSRQTAELVDILEEAPVDFPPGARWSYSNANYLLLALVVERVTKLPYEEALAVELFRPQGLTSLRQCPSIRRMPAEARGHILRDGAVVPSAPENMNWIRGDGGLCGHALDLATWLRRLASGRVLTPASYRLMSAPTPLPGGRLADYGFGLSLIALDGRRKVAHNGAMAGFSASAAYYPDDAVTVVVLANRGDVRTEVIERRIARHVLGLPEPVFTERRLSAQERGRFAGQYDIGVFTIGITPRGDRLWLEMPRPGPTTPLRYLGGGEFVSESAPEAYRVTFPRGGQDAGELRLFMAAMHWYGVRVPAAADGPGR